MIYKTSTKIKNMTEKYNNLTMKEWDAMLMGKYIYIILLKCIFSNHSNNENNSVQSMEF